MRGARAGRHRAGRPTAAAAAAAVLVAVLTACDPHSVAVRTYDGPAEDAVATPAASDAPAGQFEPGVAWVDDGARLALTIPGSSSCPYVPTGIDVPDPSIIEIEVERSGGDACTADLTLRTHEIPTPQGVAKGGPVRVEVLGIGDFELPPIGPSTTG
ncbi:hypothetical protein [Agromyces sp. SYSU T00194]|uniref:hypothetical protein n=1 Tax=Agromyces chitinivorans TaxID=3158560 RepID=UPI003392A7B3